MIGRWALRTWLDSWPGVGHVAVGMHRQGYDLQLPQYDDSGWRATFYTTGTEHSRTSATGTAWERTPWRATQAGGVAAEFAWSSRSAGALAQAGAFAVACPRPIQRKQEEADAPRSEARQVQGSQVPCWPQVAQE